MSASALRKSAPAVAAPDSLSNSDFTRLATLVTEKTGIRLPAGKRTMLEGRLRKRIRAVGAGSLDGYCRYLFDQNGLEAEITHLVDAVTTNKTDFFREPEHFEFLRKHIVPDCLSRYRGGGKPMIKLWSAAASNGAEAYTIAMVLAELGGTRGERFEFSILGTDISTDILGDAARAVYPEDFIAPVPADMQRRFLMQSRDRSNPQVRIVPELRRHVHFSGLNLMDADYRMPKDIDVIFLRNVLIYFDKPTQVAVVEKLLRHLRPGGYLMLGHSETMIGAVLPLRQLAPAVFQLM